MQRLITTSILAVALLAIPAGSAVAGPSGKGKSKSAKSLDKVSPAKFDRRVAALQCKNERKALGNKEFKAKYGKRATRTCLRQNSSEIRQERINAAKECKAERSDADFAATHDGKSFAEFYGTNENKKNAYGKCVRGKARTAAAEERADVRNAARDCKAERNDANFAATHDGKSFAEFYGTNRNQKNAYGKCVSSKAKAKDQGENPGTTGKPAGTGKPDGAGKPESTPPQS